MPQKGAFPGASDRPKPGRVLYENVFGHGDFARTLTMLAQGLEAACQNATRLVRDVQILTAEEAYASAAFLRAIADEETAKVYILLDMARVDFRKHCDKARRLCNSYYDHIDKAVYIYISRHAHLPGFASRGMAEVQKAVAREKVQLWKGSPEDGEPDEPHESILYREFNLYSDYIEHNEKWYSPCDSSARWQVDGKANAFGPSKLDDTIKSLGEVSKARTGGLFTPRALEVLHAVCSPVFLDVRTRNDELEELERKYVEQLQSTGLSFPEELRDSFVLRPWPLYALI